MESILFSPNRMQGEIGVTPGRIIILCRPPAHIFWQVGVKDRVRVKVKVDLMGLLKAAETQGEPAHPHLFLLMLPDIFDARCRGQIGPGKWMRTWLEPTVHTSTLGIFFCVFKEFFEIVFSNDCLFEWWSFSLPPCWVRQSLHVTQGCR